MILLKTIQENLLKYVDVKTLFYTFDIRYLNKWLKDYPDCFPKFVLDGNYKIIVKNLEYELHSTI